MAKSDRSQVIASYLNQIEASALPITEFFEKFDVAFRIAQYYYYKKRFERQGWSGLSDGRAAGNHRRITSERANFLSGYHAANPSSRLADYQTALELAAVDRVVGYGKKLLDDHPVRAQQQQLQQKREQLRTQLQQPLVQLSELNHELQHWINQERRLRVQSPIVDGYRQMSPPQAAQFATCQRAIAAIERQKTKIRRPYHKLFDQLQRLEQQWLRLQGNKWRQVYFKRHRKDKEMMTVLEQALPRLNLLSMHPANGRRVEFFLK